MRFNTKNDQSVILLNILFTSINKARIITSFNSGYMIEELHLPWNNSALEALMLEIVQTGEASKVDFKRELNLDTADQLAEFLKDVAACANTYEYSYRNHGFIIVGVEHNNIVGTTFSQTADALQARIDEMVKHHIGPFIHTHVRIFTSSGKAWGVVVIPPTRNAPHVFIKDGHKRFRGDIYVRRGTTTDKAQPEDFARFFSQHLSEHSYELQRQIKDIQSALNETKRELTLLKAAFKATPNRRSDGKVNEGTKQSLKPKPLSLLEEIDEALASEEDPIKHHLIMEARKIQSFLETNTIPWVLQMPSKEDGQKLFTGIEKEASIYWMALANILNKDDKGKYDDAIIKSLGQLARYQEAPAGVSYTELGCGIRYYPLIVSLYIIFAVGAFRKREALLKKVGEMQLTRRSLYEDPYSIAYALFFIHRAGDVFQIQYDSFPNSKWCDPVASFTKILLDRMLIVNDYLWNKDVTFYIGEFLLCLLPLDVLDSKSGIPAIGHPSSGLFLYIHDSIPAIQRFLQNESGWISKIFHRPLQEILKEFDETAHKLSSGLCWTHGFVSGAVQAAFPSKSTSDVI
jgi:hypothetical protein